MESNNNKNIERRKRKMVENNNKKEGGDDDVHLQQEQEENEEEKIEQFFALIRNTKDMKDRLKQRGIIAGLSYSSKQHQNEKNKQLEEDEEEDLLRKGSGFNTNNNNVEAQTWNPTFQVEDFMDDSAKSSKIIDININISQDATTQELLPGSSSKSQEEEAKRGNNGDNLDLKLSL